jgi:hypothetical protein
MKKNFEIVIAILGIIIIVLSIVLFKKNPSSEVPSTDTKENTTVVSTPITITDAEIQEANFKATKSVVAGTGVVADASRAYIDGAIALFKQSADQEVPDIRAEFGSDNPTTNYEINLKATYVKSSKTESIVIDQYVYTGGANGSDSYKVFTASLASGKLLALSDIVIPSKQAAFTAYVKKALTDMRPDGGKAQVTFPEEVKALTFDSFKNWSYTDKSIFIYFDKYEVGPGVLGAIALPIPLSKVKDLLVTGY